MNVVVWFVIQVNPRDKLIFKQGGRDEVIGVEEAYQMDKVLEVSFIILSGDEQESNIDEVIQSPFQEFNLFVSLRSMGLEVDELEVDEEVVEIWFEDTL